MGTHCLVGVVIVASTWEERELFGWQGFPTVLLSAAFFSVWLYFFPSIIYTKNWYLFCMIAIKYVTNLCLAAMHLIWSSNTNFADKRGSLLGVFTDKGRCTVMCKHRESSLSPVTSRSCKNPTNLATPHPNLRVSGSTRINCSTSITKNRLIFWPSLVTTVQAIKSLLSTNKFF